MTDLGGVKVGDELAITKTVIRPLMNCYHYSHVVVVRITPKRVFASGPIGEKMVFHRETGLGVGNAKGWQVMYKRKGG